MTGKTKRTQAIAPASTALRGEAREFRKTNEAIGLRIREGRLSLLSRKLYNVMVYHAQQQKQPGHNAPIDTPTAKKYFWIPLAEVARDAAYDSNDTELLKAHIEEFQNIKIHMENDRAWTSERLVSSVKIVNPLGLNKRGGTVWFGFAFPPEVYELVMNPGTYTKLSIYYQGLLNSGAAVALYEICRRYATNPSKVTASETYAYWYGALTGNPVRDEPSPYKYFKRDVLKPAIAEVNATTDIDVELIEHKNGRRVERLQFAVDMKRQSGLEFPAPPVINGELIDRIVKIGFSPQEAADLTAQHSEAALTTAMEVLRARMRAPNSAPVDSPAAYFRWVLKQGGAAPKVLASPAKEVRKPETKEPRSLRDQQLAQRGRAALVELGKLDEPARADVVTRFLRTSAGRSVPRGLGVESAVGKSALGLWYADELWGAATGEVPGGLTDTRGGGDA